MPLPKISHPTFEEKIPSTGETVEIRPFLVKEEKILLLAQQSGEERDMIRALKQVISNCIVTKGFDVNKLALFDLEYMFVRLRARSVDNVITVVVNDSDDGQRYELDIDLDDIKVIFPENHEKEIKIDDDSGIILKYPSAKMLDALTNTMSQEEILTQLTLGGIECIYNGEHVIYPDEDGVEEIEEFIDNLTLPIYEKIRTFFVNLPKLNYTINYTNSKGDAKKVVLNSLRDFFTWDSPTII